MRNQVRKRTDSICNLIRLRRQLCAACNIAVNLLQTPPRGTPVRRQNLWAMTRNTEVDFVIGSLSGQVVWCLQHCCQPTTDATTRFTCSPTKSLGNDKKYRSGFRHRFAVRTSCVVSATLLSTVLQTLPRGSPVHQQNLWAMTRNTEVDFVIGSLSGQVMWCLQHCCQRITDATTRFTCSPTKSLGNDKKYRSGFRHRFAVRTSYVVSATLLSTYYRRYHEIHLFTDKMYPGGLTP
ncbi:uncharacterized protein LOC114873956 [Osmia bicornis bicornis]|uniref:uncharacterized protein LOC114873956 n=1 Tax=Osmia bicornis bicornis TaxID=1437191 RepID=UPI001EAF2B9B|nr:uncharacterized protein LOC114873956 [Osmia bicornis bicornis]